MITLLHGYLNEDFKNAVEKRLDIHGIEHRDLVRGSKLGIAKCIMTDNINVCIISEKMISGDFTAEEMLWLCDERNIQLIPLLDKKHIGSGDSMLYELYKARVYDAVFLEDSIIPILPDVVASLIIRGRTPGAARAEYRI